MGYTVLSRSQLQMAVPALAEMAKDGFVAAYEGPGGVFVVYSPRVARDMLIGGAKPVQLVTYVSQPTMVVIPGKRWEEGTANACAQALAMQDLVARRDGTVLVLTEEEVQRVLGGPSAAQPDVEAAIRTPPIATLLGMSTLSLGTGVASVELAADERHAGPTGILHGGVLADLADFAMTLACKTSLAPDETFTTLELKINFLKSLSKGNLKGDARIKRRSQGAILVECNVYDDTGTLVAFATSTCMVRSV
jgi:uncharacterized protein (TIGR00369 family)